MPGQGMHASAMKTLIRPDSIRSTLDRWHLTGPSVVPGEPAWDAARQAWNLAVDQQPMAVVFPRTVADVTAVVEIARTTGAKVVTQGTGHGASAYGSMRDTILIRTDWGASRARVMVTTVHAPEREHWREWIPEHPTDMLENLAAVDGMIYLVYLHDAYTRIEVRDLEGALDHDLELPGIGTAKVQRYAEPFLEAIRVWKKSRRA